jgi:hypothetical protein
MKGTDEMSTTLVLIVLGGLLGASFYLVKQWKHYLIRHTGTLVMAKVTQVQSWREAPRADFSLQTKMIPLLGGRCWYELRAEWTDPHIENTYVFTSGIKKGLSPYQRDDHIPAYVSPYGNYLELS